MLPGGLAPQRRLWWLLWSGCPGLAGLAYAARSAFGSLQAAWRTSAEPVARAARAGAKPGWATDRGHRRRWGADPMAQRQSPVASRPRRVLLPVIRPLPGPWPSWNVTPGPLLGWSRHAFGEAARAPGHCRGGNAPASLHGSRWRGELGAASGQAGWPWECPGPKASIGRSTRLPRAGGRLFAVPGTPWGGFYPPSRQPSRPPCPPTGC